MSRFMFLPIVILVLTWCNWNATPTSFLYPSFDPLTSRKVIEKLDLYLDINPYDEVDQITQTLSQQGVPIFSFEGTNHVQNGENRVFSG